MRILLTGMCGHGALRRILRERILSRGVMRRRLQRSGTFALEVYRRTVFLWRRRILRRGLVGVVLWVGRRGRREGVRL